MNKQETTTIIILPGIQYTPKGALNVDKIRITAYADNTPVDLYTIKTEPSRSIELKNTNNNNDCYPTIPYEDTDILYSNIVNEDIKRVKPGYFHRQDGNDQSYIGVFMPNTPEVELSHQYSHQDSMHHDGLCYILTTKDNVDILFKIQLYSQVSWTESEVEDNYVLFDEFTIAYNPIINGFSDSSISKADPISLYYDPAKNENDDILIKLLDNVIILEEEGNQYKVCVWNDKEGYKKTDTSVDPTTLKIYTYPQVMIDKTGYSSQDNKMNFYSSSVKGSLRGLMQYKNGIINAPYSIESITPIITNKGGYGINGGIHTADKFSNFSKNVKDQQKYFLDLNNSLLNVKVSEYHKYGIYNTNLFDEGNFEQNGEGYYTPQQFYCAVNTLLEHDYQYQGLAKDQYPEKITTVNRPDIVKQGVTQRAAIWNNNGNVEIYSTHYTEGGLIKQIPLYNALHLNLLRASISGNSIDTTLWERSFGNHITSYNWLSNTFSFEYLCTTLPYISIKNFGQPPIGLKQINDANKELTLRSVNFQVPSNFIPSGTEVRQSLNAASQYWWNWKCQDYNDQNNSYIFPNYCLAVLKNKSELKFRNKSNYQIVPYITFKEDDDYFGIYQSGESKYNLVLSNIDTESNLFTYSDTKEIITGSYKQKVLKPSQNVIKSNINIQKKGLYVFKYNGFCSNSSYSIKLSILHNDTTYTKNINQNYPLSYIAIYLTEGSYTFTLQIASSISITAAGLYAVDTNKNDMKPIYNTKLEEQLSQRGYKTVTIIEHTDPIYQYIVLPAAYVYCEQNKIFYDKKYNSIYTPNEAFLNIHGAYEVKSSDTEPTIITTPKHKILGGFAQGDIKFNLDFEIKSIEI